MWTLKKYSRVKLKNPLLIEGLPGIGNVGKIAVDYLVSEMKAKLYGELFSFHMPPAVVVNEEGLLKMHTLKLSYKRLKKYDVLFFHGDVQPSDEIGIYSLCDEVLKFCRKHGVKEIITTGGIGLSEVEKPKIYATSSNKDVLRRYKKLYKRLNINMFGHVGPIIGVTGILSAMAGKYGIDAVTLLVDTFNDPLYFGVSSSKLILDVIGKRIDMRFNFEKITKEIENIEKEAIKNIKEVETSMNDTSYIG